MISRLLLVSALLATSAIAGDLISITQINNNKTIEVAPVQVTDSEVTFQVSGKPFTVPLARLTEDSRSRLHDWQQGLAQKESSIYEQINAAIGSPLFQIGSSLWTEDAAAVAKRLNWPQESASKSSSSFRRYPKAEDRFLQARPYCCTLYANETGKSESLSVVFANKGDFNSSVGFGEDHFKKSDDTKTAPRTLNEAITQDIDTISKLLTELFDEPSEQRYGEKEDRRNAQRWNFKDHAFILSKREDEYAHLLVVDRETADREGKVKFVKDQDLRDQLATNVRRDDNGDVYIENIPMVNQGPKGYCAPATFERAMRYMLVPADMYLLATLATAPGGGTNTGALAAEAKRIISSKARRIKDLNLGNDLSARHVSRYIDKGVPILWQMASMPEYNKTANELTKKRKDVSDMAAWAQTVASESERVAPGLSPTSNFHICMIIGYNETTGELAVSDSWGPSYALRWVPVDVAKAVTMAGGFVIDL